jgi:preprotein translocase subunit SecA
LAKFEQQTLGSRIRSLFGGPNQWRLNRWYGLLPAINGLEPELMALADDQLRKRSLSLRYRAKSGVPLSELMPEAYAVVREAGRRTMNMRHFDVQMLGGAAMHERCIAEMQTGEGKTLTATLPMYLNCLTGKGAHLATVNDYLAKRDAEWMTPIYEMLGATIGIIQSEMKQDERRKNYACDMTYGTSKEFGFDFLRDRLVIRKLREQSTDFLGSMLGHNPTAGAEQPVQREHQFILVDEADSLLIDDAGTPLIIGTVDSDEETPEGHCYGWAAEVNEQFEEDIHYDYDHEKHTVELTVEGRQLARSMTKPDSLATIGMTTIYDFLERAIRVRREYFRDVQYVVRDGEVQIVDEFTGRISEGRKWRDGIHQAVEAKEGLKIKGAGGQAARVTVQDFFLRYKHIGGMTGTAWSSAREMKNIYKVNVIPIPTNRPPIRKSWPTQVYGTEEQKFVAIVEEIRKVHGEGRPVLIGTRSIDKSEQISALLTAEGLDHMVLNAHKVDEEAEIVKHAGETGKITVSTNMAGRGTDIRLGPGVHDLGGLHVIATEMHDSARIDRQLMGRCGRQGDPGTNHQYLSLDDEILQAGFGPDKARKYKELGERSKGPFHHMASLFKKAQRKIERQKFRQRRVLLHIERERNKAQIAMGQDPYLDSPG